MFEPELRKVDAALDESVPPVGHASEVTTLVSVLPRFVTTLPDMPMPTPAVGALPVQTPLVAVQTLAAAPLFSLARKLPVESGPMIADPAAGASEWPVLNVMAIWLGSVAAFTATGSELVTVPAVVTPSSSAEFAVIVVALPALGMKLAVSPEMPELEVTVHDPPSVQGMLLMVIRSGT